MKDNHIVVALFIIAGIALGLVNHTLDAQAERQPPREAIWFAKVGDHNVYKLWDKGNCIYIVLPVFTSASPAIAVEQCRP